MFQNFMRLSCFDIDNTLDIYTKFGKIKSLDITLEDKKINMFINNKEKE